MTRSSRNGGSLGRAIGHGLHLRRHLRCSSSVVDRENDTDTHCTHHELGTGAGWQHLTGQARENKDKDKSSMSAVAAALKDQCTTHGQFVCAGIGSDEEEIKVEKMGEGTRSNR